MSIKELSQSILDASKAVIELSEMKVSIQIVPGSEKKLMPLAKKAGVRFVKPKPGDDEASVVGDKKGLRKFMMARGMSAGDIEDSHPELKEESIEEKKLDPVGKADADIDNDGDTDSSDEYLHKRRNAIKQAMKKEGNKFTLALSNAREKGEKSFVCAGKKYTVDEVEELEKDPKKKEIKEKDVKETTMMSGKPEKKSIHQVRKDMQKSVDNANQKLKDAEMRKRERIRKIARADQKEELVSDLLPILEKYDVELINEIIGNLGHRMPQAGADSAGIRKASGKDGGPDKKDSGMDNKEKVGYNALLQIAKKLFKAYNDEATANSDEEEDRAINQVYKYRKEFESKAKFYKSSTAQKAKADARKAVPPKERG